MADLLSSDQRTQLQRDADAIDCDLYRVYLKAERLYAGHRDARQHLERFMAAIRETRPHIRVLMHSIDRERTL